MCILKLGSTGCAAKMVEQEDPKQTFSQGHIKVTTVYRETSNEKGKTNRKKFSYN